MSMLRYTPKRPSTRVRLPHVRSPQRRSRQRWDRFGPASDAAPGRRPTVCCVSSWWTGYSPRTRGDGSLEEVPGCTPLRSAWTGPSDARRSRGRCASRGRWTSPRSGRTSRHDPW